MKFKENINLLIKKPKIFKVNYFKVLELEMKN